MSGCSVATARESLFPVGGFQDRELAPQRGFQETADRALVVHHQNTQISLGHSRLSWNCRGNQGNVSLQRQAYGNNCTPARSIFSANKAALRLDDAFADG